MGPIALSFDVTAALPAEASGGQRITIAAWLFLPDDLAKLEAKPVVMTLLNGGSYDKRYYHVEIPGHPGYSAGEYIANLGNIVLVPDHLGVGESTRLPVQARATRQVVALANHAAVGQFAERLRKGEVHPSLPPIAEFHNVGGGHSMGGMQTITQQAEYATYEAVMILGYTADGVHMTLGGQLVRADTLPGEPPKGDYLKGGRDYLHEGFHWSDVPPEVIAADDAMAVETPALIGMESIRTGVVVEDAGRIEAPIYLCLGERDVSPDPHAEPAYYKRCRDFTLHILPKSGHCQNFASTRRVMWDRMHAWARSLAA